MSNASKMDKTEVLRAKLSALKVEHRDLDQAIHAMQERASQDMLALRRLKIRKLALKDEITRLEDQITPDIIA